MVARVKEYEPNLSQAILTFEEIDRRPERHLVCLLDRISVGSGADGWKRDGFQTL